LDIGGWSHCGSIFRKSPQKVLGDGWEGLRSRRCADLGPTIPVFLPFRGEKGLRLGGHGRKRMTEVT
jgi:hypothetical protein